MPVLLLLLLGIIQYALYDYAKGALLSAAQTAASIDSAADGAGGRTAGASVAEQAGVADVTISESRSDTQLNVTATGKAVTIFPIRGLGHIAQSVRAPVERVTTP